MSGQWNLPEASQCVNYSKLNVEEVQESSSAQCELLNTIELHT